VNSIKVSTLSSLNNSQREKDVDEAKGTKSTKKAETKAQKIPESNLGSKYITQQLQR